MIMFKYLDGILQVAGKGTFGDAWLNNLGVKMLQRKKRDLQRLTLNNFTSGTLTFYS